MHESPAKQKLINDLARLDIRQKQFNDGMTEIIDEMYRMKKNMERWQLALKMTGLAAAGYTVIRCWHQILAKTQRLLHVLKILSVPIKGPLYERNRQTIDKLMTNHPDKRYWSAVNNAAKYLISVGTDPTALTNIGLLLSSQKTTVPESIAELEQRIEDAYETRLAGDREFIRKRNLIRRLLRAPEYTVIKGDCLWKIAKRHWGDGNLWRELYLINIPTIGNNPDLIYPDQKLIIARLNKTAS